MAAHTDDWTNVRDPTQRRRIQNRIAQRNYRQRIKKRLEELEKREASRIDYRQISPHSPPRSTVRIMQDMRDPRNPLLSSQAFKTNTRGSDFDVAKNLWSPVKTNLLMEPVRDQIVSNYYWWMEEKKDASAQYKSEEEEEKSSQGSE